MQRIAVPDDWCSGVIDLAQTLIVILRLRGPSRGGGLSRTRARSEQGANEGRTIVVMRRLEIVEALLGGFLDGGRLERRPRWISF